MRATPVSLIGGFYADDTLPWSCQDTVNWLPVMAEVEGTLTPSKLATPPGLMPYQQIGAGPIRGMHDLEGGRFIVSGRYLYRINNDGVGIRVGTIPGVGRVTMTHNQFKTGYQMLIENGQGGGGYVYDSNTQTLARITDEGYPGSISSDYLDSYLLGVEPQGRYWFHSNLADATDYNTLDRYESEASPDKIVGLAVSQFEVVVFNQRTIEFFYNAGGATGTFQNRRQSITRGCASRHSIAKLDNTLFWLGDDGVVYRLEGYSARPVSTGPMHRAFAGKNWAEAFAFTWEDRGFKVYYLTFPDGMTFGYDVVSGLWTRRESFGLNRWRLSHTVKWGGKWYGGDYRDGRSWELNWDYFLEGDQEFISRRISPDLHDSQSLLGIPFAELQFDTGEGPATEAVAFPVQPSEPVPSGNAPDAAVNAPYTPYQYTVTGGTAPFRFSIVGGALPPGMTLSVGGQIASSPTSLGAYSFTVRVVDSEGLWNELSDAISVSRMSIGIGSISGVRRTKSSVDGVSWVNPSVGTFSGALTMSGVDNGRFILNLSNTYYYSDTYGLSWSQLPVGSNEPYSRTDTLGGVVLACRGNNGGVGRYGRSLDNGLSFTWQNTSLGFDVHIPLFSRTIPGRVIMIGTTAFRWAVSTDGGSTFPSSVLLPAGMIGRSASWGGGAFYIAGDSTNPRVIKSSDGLIIDKSKVVDLLSTSSVAQVLCGKVGSSDSVVLITQDGSIYISKDDLATFVKSPFSIPGSFSVMVHNSNRFLLACSAGIYASVDPEAGFELVNSGFVSPSWLAVSPL